MVRAKPDVRSSLANPGTSNTTKIFVFLLTLCPFFLVAFSRQNSFGSHLDADFTRLLSSYNHPDVCKIAANYLILENLGLGDEAMLQT